MKNFSPYPSLVCSPLSTADSYQKFSFPSASVAIRSRALVCRGATATKKCDLDPTKEKESSEKYFEVTFHRVIAVNIPVRYWP